VLGGERVNPMISIMSLAQRTAQKHHRRRLAPACQRAWLVACSGRLLGEEQASLVPMN
jgi:hypothetical protein